MSQEGHLNINSKVLLKIKYNKQKVVKKKQQEKKLKDVYKAWIAVNYNLF